MGEPEPLIIPLEKLSHLAHALVELAHERPIVLWNGTGMLARLTPLGGIRTGEAGRDAIDRVLAFRRAVRPGPGTIRELIDEGRCS
ncbi:hypothetical protein [Tepidiforma sp.]|uniref:hypothetical protein n=1 Tax=Tepidiforma sp. TaxID=2682230 RepID=UPI002ADDCFC7|nr:hypothetical protein [Tepidiforma sp.]